jgi:hypothetical protein
VLRPLAAGQYLAPRVTNLALQYLTRALELKNTYKQLKPHIEPLLSQVGQLTLQHTTGELPGVRDSDSEQHMQHP